MVKENVNTTTTNNNNKEEKDQKNILIGVIYKSAAELKLLLTALLIISTILTIFQLLPSNLSFSFSVSDLRRCISTPTPTTTTTTTTTTPRPPPPPPKTTEIQSNGIVKRSLIPIGSAAYNFILMSAYRGGPNSFAINALSSKPLHVFGKPTYQCQWVPLKENLSTVITTTGNKILPDWGYGRVYTVVVINCTFPDNAVIGNKNGGKLLVHATTNGGGDTSLNITDSVEALYEQPGSLDLSVFTDEPTYDYLYCGSSLYGDLSPQRLREWLAYHVRIFGERSHFVFHDAGGVHEGVVEVLKVWMEKGYVTLHDIREEEKFDGYYHNQFLVVNDCLHRYRFMTKWMLFFDVDEFIFVEKKSSIKSVFDSLSGFTQFTISQRPMSNKLCLEEDRGTSYRKWGFEKLVYRDTKRGVRRDRKYAVQPRNVFATGVHMSQNFVGKSTHNTEGRIMYYHYHGTISERREPCRQLVNNTDVKFEGTPYVMDTTMRDVAGAVKMFELKMIGNKLQRTRQ